MWRVNLMLVNWLKSEASFDHQYFLCCTSKKMKWVKIRFIGPHSGQLSSSRKLTSREKLQMLFRIVPSQFYKIIVTASTAQKRGPVQHLIKEQIPQGTQDHWLSLYLLWERMAWLPGRRAWQGRSWLTLPNYGQTWFTKCFLGKCQSRKVSPFWHSGNCWPLSLHP